MKLSIFHPNFRKLKFAFPLFWLVCFFVFLLNRGEFSKTVEVNALFFCRGKNQSGILLPKLDFVISNLNEQIYICGKIKTDGRPAAIGILIYRLETNELIYVLPDSGVPEGEFAYALPKKIMALSGTYRADVTYEHQILETCRIFSK